MEQQLKVTLFITRYAAKEIETFEAAVADAKGLKADEVVKMHRQSDGYISDSYCELRGVSK